MNYGLYVSANFDVEKCDDDEIREIIKICLSELGERLTKNEMSDYIDNLKDKDFLGGE